MGCSIYAHAIIGLRVPMSKVRTGKRKIKAFEHNHPEDWEVDPKSGKKLWREEDTYIDGYDGDHLCGYPAIKEPDGPDEIFVCLVHVETSDVMEGAAPKRVQFEKMSENLGHFQKAMREIGVWDCSEFGLWAAGFAYC